MNCRTAYLIALAGLTLTACGGPSTNSSGDGKSAGQRQPVSAPRDATGPAIGTWTQRLVAKYDPREERAKFLARSGDAGMKDAISMWEEALRGRLPSDTSRQELFFFLPRYSAIWKVDAYQQPASTERASRARSLSAKEIAVWAPLQSPGHGAIIVATPEPQNLPRAASRSSKLAPKSCVQSR
jgi:hypothetical protein